MKIRRDLLVLALLSVAAVAPLQAQRGAGFQGRAPGPYAGRSLNAVLENREALGLTEGQINQLQELKAIQDAEVAPVSEEIKALREQIRDGEVDREEGYRQLQALRGELMTASAPLRGRVQEILTVQQHRQLQAELFRNRPGRGTGGAFQRGRGGAARPGIPGGGRSGFGPRQGFQGQGRSPAPGFRQGPPGAAFGPGPVGPRPGTSGPGWMPTRDPARQGNLYPLG